MKGIIMRLPRFFLQIAVSIAGAAGIFLLFMLFSRSPQPAAASEAGWALEFDGVDDQVVLNSTMLMMGAGWTETKTVNLWALPTRAGRICASSDVANCDLIFGDFPRWWGISIGEINGNDRIFVWNYDGNFDVIPVPYTVNEWVNIALVHEEGELRAYKNGAQVGFVNSGYTRQPHTGAFPTLYFGGTIKLPSTVWAFQGQIDELRLWNRALSASEIQDGMFAELNGDESGLRAYYSMLPGSGLTVYDDSLADWNGTLLDGKPPEYAGNGTPPQWVESGAFEGVPPTPTPTDTETPTPTPTDTETPTPTPTDTEAPTATQTEPAVVIQRVFLPLVVKRP